MPKRKKQFFICAALAFFTCYFFRYSIAAASPVLLDAVAIFMPPIWIGLLMLYKKAWFPCSGRRRRLSMFFGLLMGIMVFLGMEYANSLRLASDFMGSICILSALTLLFASLLSLLLLFLPKYSGYLEEKGVWNGKIKKAGKRGWFLLFIGILLIWLPAYLAAFPGIYSYDASVQVDQFFGAQPLTTHHPPLHTLLFGGCLKLGGWLFKSYQAGLALYSAVQMAVMAAIFAYVLFRMIKKDCSLWLLLFTFLFLVINPYMQVFILLTTKDILFGGAFLLTFLFAWDMAEDPEKFLKSRSSCGRLFISSLFMCFLRNQGIHVFLFYSLFTALFLAGWIRKRKRREGGKETTTIGVKRAVGKWLILTAGVAALYLSVTGPVFSLLGIGKGDAREALSVPMQQLARVYNKTPEQLNEEEQDYIERLILPEYLARYIPVNADPVKSGFQTSVLKEDPGKFVKTWLSVGVKAPRIYADSFLGTNWGYWYPGKTQYWIHYILFDGAFMEEDFNLLGIRRTSLFPAYEQLLRTWTLTPAYEAVPILAIILNQAFPFWLMLIASAVFIYQNRYLNLLPLPLILGYWGTLILGPVTSARYAFALMLCVPVLLIMILDKHGGK